MSHEEQAALIGRLVLGRVEGNRQRALLANEIKGWQTRLAVPTDKLSNPDVEANLIRATGLKDGGLDSLRKTLEDYWTLARRIAEMGQTLRNAGAG